MSHAAIGVYPHPGVNDGAIRSDESYALCTS